MDVCEQRMLDEFAQNMFDGEMRFLYVLGVCGSGPIWPRRPFPADEPPSPVMEMVRIEIALAARKA